MKTILVSLIILLNLPASDRIQIRENLNFHKVSSELYRCGQPNKKDMKTLELLGIKTLLNLRLRCDDQGEVKGSTLTEIHIPIKTTRLRYSDMVSAMRAFDKAPKPVVVHCRRGSDRTGCFVACYRILYEGWSKEKAIDSLLNDGLGYYENLFPELKKFVVDLEIDQFKKDVFAD